MKTLLKGAIRPHSTVTLELPRRNDDNRGPVQVDFLWHSTMVEGGAILRKAIGTSLGDDAIWVRHVAYALRAARAAKIAEGDRVLIFGLSTLGNILGQVIGLKRNASITAIGESADQISAAQACGITQACGVSDLRSETGPWSTIFLTTPRLPSEPRHYPPLAEANRIILLHDGQFESAHALEFLRQVHFRNLRVSALSETDLFDGQSAFQADISEAISILSGSLLRLANLPIRRIARDSSYTRRLEYFGGTSSGEELLVTYSVPT